MQCLIRILLLLGLLSCLEAQTLTCQASTNDYDCMASPNANSSLYWTLRGIELCMRLEATTLGWVGIGFARRPGRMFPAETVIGWVDEDGPDVNIYDITGYRVTSDNVDPNITLRNVTGTETGNWTIIEFCLDLTDLSIEVDPEEATPINLAFGNRDGLVYHGPARGSTTIRFAHLPDDDVPPPSGGIDTDDLTDG